MIPVPARPGTYFDDSLDPDNPMVIPGVASPSAFLPPAEYASPPTNIPPVPSRTLPPVGPSSTLVGTTPPPVPGLFGGIGNWFTGQDMAGQGPYGPDDYRRARSNMLMSLGANLMAAGQPMTGAQRAQIIQGMPMAMDRFRNDLKGGLADRQAAEALQQQKTFDEYSANPENLKSLGFNENQITLLSKLPRDERSKAIEGALDAQFKPGADPNWVEVKTADGVYMVNQKDPTQFKKIGENVAPAGTENQQFDNEAKLRGEYIKQSSEYQGTSHAYNRVQAAASDQSGASDVALVYGFMKMLDPTSAVREGEYATAEQTGGLPQQVVSMYNRAVTGERLSPEMRQNFVKQATSQFQTAQETYNQTREMYRKQAQAYGLDPDRVAPDLTYGVAPREQGGTSADPNKVPIYNPQTGEFE